MKRSRIALLLFMATFAASLMAAGLAGGEGSMAAEREAADSSRFGYCEFAYDPIDEHPYDACDYVGCEFAPPPSKTPQPVAVPKPWYGDFADDCLDSDELNSSRTYMPPKVAASLDEPLYGIPAEDEVPLDPRADEVADPESEDATSVDEPLSPAAQTVEYPAAPSPYDLGSCTRHCWPELYGDTDVDDQSEVEYSLVHPNRTVDDIVAGAVRSVAKLLGNTQPSSRADFVRRSDREHVDPAWARFQPASEPVAAAGPDPAVVAAWGEWLQTWAIRGAAVVGDRAGFYLRNQGSTPAPVGPRITLRWSKIDLAGRTYRIFSGLWAGYRDAAWGASKTVCEMAGFPSLLDQPARHAQDPAVRTRTSLRTPWRIDL